MIVVINFLIKLIATILGYIIASIITIISIIMWDEKFMYLPDKIFKRIWRKN